MAGGLMRHINGWDGNEIGSFLKWEVNAVLHPRRYLLLAAVMLSSVSALAQSQQRPEFFIGYSNLQAEGLQDNFFSTNLFSRRTTFHGGNGEVTFFPFQTFGITGDLSLNRRHKSADVTGGSDSETTDIAYFMGGPSYVFSNVSERLQPFARILLGVAHTRYKA